MPNNPSKGSVRCDGLRLKTDAPKEELDNVCSPTGVARFVPHSGGFDLVCGFAFFVEVDQYQKSNIKNQNDRSKRQNRTNPNVKII